MSPVKLVKHYSQQKNLHARRRYVVGLKRSLFSSLSDTVSYLTKAITRTTRAHIPIVEEPRMEIKKYSLNVILGIRQLTETPESNNRLPTSKKLGIVLVLFAIGGLLAAAMPFFGLEYRYLYAMIKDGLYFSDPEPTTDNLQPITVAPSPLLDHNPLVAPDGTVVTPVNSYFSLVIPKIGVNAPVVPGVNPVEKKAYTEALKKGVAHANTSYYPNENGTVYLFSHSTNYEWFVKDLNAVFYLLKKLDAGDEVVVMYLGNRYTYKIREKKVVGSREVSYLIPASGKRTLILQTCWPPGTAYKRLLIFADLVEERQYGSFEDILL